MKPKIVLVNPWIHDFAAVNLWSRPLGLIQVAEYLSQYDVDIKLIDCMDAFVIQKRYGTGKYPRQIVKKPDLIKNFPRNYARYGISIELFKKKLDESLPYDAVFVTSIMTYWYPGIQLAIEIIKSQFPDIPVVLGGIYATLFYEHAVGNSGADIIFKGQINHHQNMDSLLELSNLYFEKKIHERKYYSLDLYDQFPFAPLITSEGCPYECTYCASGVLNADFKQYDPSEVVHDIHELHKRGVVDFAFYDDALFVKPDNHIKMILRKVIKSGLKIRFHTPNGVHARFIDEELAMLMKQAGFTTIRLSLETVNRDRQDATGGKVTNLMFEESVRNLKTYGFTKDNIGTYLMYGLPGQGLYEVREGINFLKKLSVRINLTEFSPIPGTGCWDELVDNGVIDIKIDPLLTNNSVFSFMCADYSYDDIETIKRDVKQYNQAD